MARFTAFARRHKAALLLALLVALLHGGHHAFAYRALRAEGLPYYPALVNTDEAIVNGPRAHQFALTLSVPGDINLIEYADAPGAFPPLPAMLMGTMERALGSVHRAFIAGDLVFPALSFFLFYLLFFELSAHRLFSLLGASVSVFIPRFFAWFPLLTDYHQAWLTHYLFGVPGRLPFDRFEDPQATVVFFALALFLAARALMRREAATPALAGLAFGVLFYVYFYYWTYFAVALAMLLVALLLARERVRFARMCAVALIGLFASVPFWFNFAAVAGQQNYADFIARIGPEFTRRPFLYATNVFSYIQHAALAFLLFFLAPKRLRAAALFLGALLLALFLVMNFQVVTGYNPQPDHWIKPRQIAVTLAFLFGAYLVFRYRQRLLSARVLLPLALLSLLGFIYKAIVTENPFVTGVSLVGAAAAAGALALMRAKHWRERLLPRVLRAGAVCAIAFLFVRGAVTQAVFARDKALEGTLPPAVAASYEWLARETPRGSVVGSPSFLTQSHIPLLTGNAVFIPYGINTVASDEEILERFFIAAKLYGIPPETLGRFFATPERYPPGSFDEEGISYLFTDKFRAAKPGSIFSAEGYAAPVFDEGTHRRLVDAYRNYSAPDPRNLPYRLDYLYFGPAERSYGQDPRKTLAGLIAIYEKDGVVVYTMTSASVPPRR